MHLRLKGDDWDDLTRPPPMRAHKFDEHPGLVTIEDSLPLPGIDWQIDVDVEKAGRYGANVATVGGMVQLVTRGMLAGHDARRQLGRRNRYPRAPAGKRPRAVTLDTLKVRTADGLVPLSNFITRKPVAKLAQINRVDQKRYFDVKAATCQRATGPVRLLSKSTTAWRRMQRADDRAPSTFACTRLEASKRAMNDRR